MLRRASYTLLAIVMLLLGISCQDPVFDPNDGLAYRYIARPYIYDLHQKTQRLSHISNNSGADFIFITDTHLADNDLDSPFILQFLVDNGFTRRVVWGGDAITAYGDIEQEWKHHQRLFLDAVRPKASYLMVRGNHEFSTKDESTGLGMTFTPLHTARLFREHYEPQIIRPTDDVEACYYYLDDTSQRLRYCVFDTTDSISSVNDGWGTIVHISERQLQWMDDNALHNVPEGYSLVVFTHIGIVPETFYQAPILEPLYRILHEAEAPILMVISGHMHQDFQTYSDGVLHVLTGSDATYGEYSHSPFLHNFSRQRNRASSQLLDCVCLSADRRMVDMVRIGAGYDRTFHLDRQMVSLSGANHSLRLKTERLDAADVERWICYNAEGYECPPNKSWDPPSDIITVDNQGTINPLREGQAVVMAISRKGDKEFFTIQVNP